jgi:prepilin signal peptidase PulO-like enzyme (type II secretory pathway)
MGSDDVSSLLVTTLIAGIFGLFVGSFINVVVYRSPLGLSVSSPRSFCPSCKRQLTWWENIPVASWIALRGRCRTCHLSISPRYPVVEVSTGIIFGLVTWAWHGTLLSAAYCCLAAAMIAVSLVEYDGQRAPLSIAAIGTGVALVIIVVGGGWKHHWHIVIGSLIGTVIAAAAFAVLRTVDPECRDPRGRGRSALLIAGCWAGGLGLRPTVTGVAVWIAVYFVCMVGAWKLARTRSASGAGPLPDPRVHPVLAVPLVSAVAAGMVASLVVWR